MADIIARAGQAAPSQQPRGHRAGRARRAAAIAISFAVQAALIAGLAALVTEPRPSPVTPWPPALGGDGVTVTVSAPGALEGTDYFPGLASVVAVPVAPGADERLSVDVTIPAGAGPVTGISLGVTSYLGGISSEPASYAAQPLFSDDQRLGPGDHLFLLDWQAPPTGQWPGPAKVLVLTLWGPRGATAAPVAEFLQQP